jgi:hypothetical protein
MVVVDKYMIICLKLCKKFYKKSAEKNVHTLLKQFIQQRHGDMGPRNFNLAYLDLGFCSVEDYFFTKKKSAAGTTRGGTHKL